MLLQWIPRQWFSYWFPFKKENTFGQSQKGSEAAEAMPEGHGKHPGGGSRPEEPSISMYKTLKREGLNKNGLNAYSLSLDGPNFGGPKLKRRGASLSVRGLLMRELYSLGRVCY